MDETRVEVYIDGPQAGANKAVFDAIVESRASIEAVFGGAIVWQRLDDKRACRVSVSVPGGWADESTWSRAADLAVDAMIRLHGAVAPHLARIESEKSPS
jgi:hypothetical protein